MKEEELFEIAKEVVRLNKSIYTLKLTGSLMLWARGHSKRRMANDIDFVCDSLCEEGDGHPVAPAGFFITSVDGTRSRVGCVQFQNEAGVKIEFMASEEHTSEYIDGVPCAGLQGLILAKLNYARFDITPESAIKHLDDLIYLFENNEIS